MAIGRRRGQRLITYIGSFRSSVKLGARFAVSNVAVANCRHDRRFIKPKEEGKARFSKRMSQKQKLS